MRNFYYFFGVDLFQKMVYYSDCEIDRAPRNLRHAELSRLFLQQCRASGCEAVDLRQQHEELLFPAFNTFPGTSSDEHRCNQIAICRTLRHFQHIQLISY